MKFKIPHGIISDQVAEAIGLADVHESLSTRLDNLLKEEQRGWNTGNAWETELTGPELETGRKKQEAKRIEQELEIPKVEPHAIPNMDHITDLLGPHGARAYVKEVQKAEQEEALRKKWGVERHEEESEDPLEKIKKQAQAATKKLGRGGNRVLTFLTPYLPKIKQARTTGQDRIALAKNILTDANKKFKDKEVVQQITQTIVNLLKIEIKDLS